MTDDPNLESLDAVELMMAIEEGLGMRLSDKEAEALISEIKARIERGEFGDDDSIATLVRKLGPRSPHGRSGAAAQPEE